MVHIRGHCLGGLLGVGVDLVAPGTGRTGINPMRTNLSTGQNEQGGEALK